LMEDRSYWGFWVAPVGPETFSKCRGLYSLLFIWFLGRPGPHRTPKCQILHQIAKPPSTPVAISAQAGLKQCSCFNVACALLLMPLAQQLVAIASEWGGDK